MKKKYRLLRGDTKELLFEDSNRDVTLRRIRALRDIGDDVKRGVPRLRR